ncbi:MAG TPA: acyltransferase [Solirubrobacteraceae bacterium]|nr:acyltransferase [Solirubrobacteraceae bacterium]
MDTRLDEPRRLGHRPVLDGLRGIAILLVMLTHTNVLPNGYVGVDLFFALSGFLITTLLYEEWYRTGGISLRRFYGRRARRLLPALGLMIVIALMIDVVCYPMTGWPFGWKALTSALFVNNWLAATGHAKALGSLNPTWSLAQEEQFYLVWPLVLIMLLRHRARPHLVAGVLLVAIALLMAAAPTGDKGQGYSVYYSPAARAAELLFGCLGAVIWRHRMLGIPQALKHRLPVDIVATLTRRRLWRALFAVVLAYLFAMLLFDYQLSTEEVYLSACLLAVPLIVNLVGTPDSPLARVIACPPLRFLGRVSYALYLFHLLTRNVVYHYMPNGNLYVNALLTISISIALAAASWKIVESRVLARGRIKPQVQTVRPQPIGRLVPVRT